jgi:hypothetical protein
MPRYDASTYDPPAPVALVTLRRSSTEPSALNIPLLIDTGADVTLLPRTAVTQSGITGVPAAQYELAGFDGSRSTADAVDVELLFLNKVFRGRYLRCDGNHGILGRDVLANLRLLFDGPAQEWSESLLLPT